MDIASTLLSSASAKKIFLPSNVWNLSRKDCWDEPVLRTSSVRLSLKQTSGSCGVRLLLFNLGTAQSNSSAIWSASLIWCRDLTPLPALCERFITSTIPWCVLSRNGWKNAALSFNSTPVSPILPFRDDSAGYAVERIICDREGRAEEIKIGSKDKVIVTLGSMTEASSLGSMDSAPAFLKGKPEGASWDLWEKIAADRPQFGHPINFTDLLEESKWVSFTTTLRDPAFFRLIGDLTGNVPGEGGLITFPESSWLASIVLPHQPHFIGQPADVDVFWGYGLSVDKLGDFVKQPMSGCSGREIMTEIMGHLRIDADSKKILETSTCIPCMMPFITSQFLRRAKGDRPQVVPEGSKNLAFVGQFCEIPDDVVFTVEYSIRSAQMAVYSLLGLNRTPQPVYKGSHDPRVLLKAFLTLHEIHAHS